MKGFKSAGQAQRSSPPTTIDNLFHLRRNHDPAEQYPADPDPAFQAWAEVAGVAALA